MNNGESFDGRSVTFKNKLNLSRPSRQVQRVTFTARNGEIPELDFVSQFKLDPTNCTKDGGNRRLLDETTTNKRDVSISQDPATLIFVGIASTFLVAILVVVGIICWKKKKIDKSVPSSKNTKTDENHIYGTYSRGWDGEGYYGDGDKVYVTDTNDYYAA